MDSLKQFLRYLMTFGDSLTSRSCGKLPLQYTKFLRLEVNMAPLPASELVTERAAPDRSEFPVKPRNLSCTTYSRQASVRTFCLWCCRNHYHLKLLSLHYNNKLIPSSIDQVPPNLSCSHFAPGRRVQFARGWWRRER